MFEIDFDSIKFYFKYIFNHSTDFSCMKIVFKSIKPNLIFLEMICMEPFESTLEHGFNYYFLIVT